MADIRVVQIPGTQHFCLADDREITRQCLQTGRLDWDQSMASVPEIAERLKPGAVVIDVGAFIGDTTKLFLDRGCTVFAIEPREDAFLCLTHNCPSAMSLRRAVGTRGQPVSLSSTMSNTYAWNLGARQVQIGTGSTAQVALSLDELNPHACSFIKIDVEGFEPYVLDGAEQLINRTRPVLHIEINLPALRDHGFPSALPLQERLRAWGYRARPRQPERVGTDLPWDIVCTPG